MKDLDLVVCDAAAILSLRKRAILTTVLELPLTFVVCDIVFHLELGDLAPEESAALEQRVRIASMPEEDFEIVRGLVLKHQNHQPGALYTLRLAQKYAIATLLTDDPHLIVLARKYKLTVGNLDWVEGLLKPSMLTGLKDFPQRKKTWTRAVVENSA